MGIPRWMHLTVLAFIMFALIPPAIIARARVTKSSQPRIHPIPDMDNQKRYKAQQVNPRYADKRAMRYPVENTVARGELDLDDHFHRGWARDGSGNVVYFEDFPSQVKVDMAVIDRGHKKFDIYCSPCHGFAGHGDGMVAKRASVVAEATWNFDLNLHTEERRGRAPGHLYNTITEGNNNMSPYRYQIETADRWAVVAYVKTLQQSEFAQLEDVPTGERAGSSSWSMVPEDPRPQFGTGEGAGDGQTGSGTGDGR